MRRSKETHASLRDVAHRSVAVREHRFRKQGSSARQNASPTSVVHCHGAQTRLGLRGGGRLRVLSTDAVAPPSLFASPPLPADDAHRCALARNVCPARRQHRFAEVNHASDATRGAARKRIGRRGIREAGAKNGLFDRRRHRRREMPSAGNATLWRFHAHLARTVCQARRRHQVAEVNHASDATRGAARKRIGRRGIREARAKNGLFDRRRHVAERCPPRETSRDDVCMRT